MTARCPICHQVTEAEEALRLLIKWQPSTVSMMKSIHPQYRDAIEKARKALG